MKESIGIQKLKSAMESQGYKAVAEKSGLSQSILFQYCSGKRDPLAMKMRTAIIFKKEFGIEFMEWSKYTESKSS